MNFEMNLKNKMIFTSCAPLVLVVALGVAAYLSIQSLIETSQWVKHTHEVVEHAMKIEKLLVDMETGERGFLIAGKDEFLEPYDNGRRELSALTTATKELVNDNPKQVQRMEAIEASIDQWKEKWPNRRSKLNAEGAAEAQKSAVELNDMADQLKSIVEEFNM